jgi:hypothetical protein
MPLETDIVERLRADFGRVDSDTAIRLLTEARQAGRVARCIVVASRGSLPLLRANVELARSDYRDAIMAGEYERGEHLRDLSASFLIDTPEKFWIGQVALVMAPRDYALTSVETRPATVGPFEYLVDRYEGKATFAGPMGNIRVEKTARQWRAFADDPGLLRRGLDHPIGDERAFRDALSVHLFADGGPTAGR